MLKPKRKISQYSADEILEEFRRLSGWEVALLSDRLKYDKPVSCVTSIFSQEVHNDEGGNISLEYVRSRVRFNENGVMFLAFWYIVMYLRGRGKLPRNENIVVEL